LYLVSG